MRVIPESIRYGLAIRVLRQALGDHWCRRNLFDPNSAEPRFLQMGQQGAAARRAQLRAEQLGESLFNLQIIIGFNSRVELLKSSSLLAAVTELDAARLILQSGLSFVFNEPIGQKRGDFEGTLVLPSGIDACCEVKMKDETTAISEKSILESFKSALKQVPRAPTVIFLYLPGSWIGQPGTLEIAIRTANARWFGKSKRTVAVIYFWEEWREFPSGAVGRFARFKEYQNRGSRYYDDDNTDLIRPWELKSEGGLDWISFSDLAAGAI